MVNTTHFPPHPLEDGREWVGSAMKLEGCSVTIPLPYSALCEWLGRFVRAKRGSLPGRRYSRLLLEVLEDRTAPTVDLLSVTASGESANFSSSLYAGQGASLSQDGRYIVFQSEATDLVA